MIVSPYQDARGKGPVSSGSWPWLSGDQRRLSAGQTAAPGTAWWRHQQLASPSVHREEVRHEETWGVST